LNIDPSSLGVLTITVNCFDSLIVHCTILVLVLVAKYCSAHLLGLHINILCCL